MAMNDGLKTMIGTFIILVVGISLLVSIANSATDVTEVKTVTNESTALLNATAVNLDNTQLVAVSRVGNTSHTLTETTHYTYDLAQGTVTLVNLADATYDVSYTYRQVGNSTARSLISLVVIFFVIGLLLLVVAVVSPSFREMINDRFGR